jgi:hypothetical protein
MEAGLVIVKLVGPSKARRPNWKRFINTLVSAHIQLTEQRNELVWFYNTMGNYYTTKSGYLALVEDSIPDLVWWGKSLWKLKAPPKCIFLMWLVLNGKVLTWDFLQNKNFHGLGICSLCEKHSEDIQHLFIQCNFTKDVWSVVINSLQIRGVLQKESVALCFKD